MKAKLKLLVFVLIALLPNGVKILVYRTLFGATIGPGARIGFGTVLVFDTLTIGPSAVIGFLNLIRVSSMSLGPRSRIGSCSRITCHTFILGSAGTISSWVSILADHRDPRSSFEAGAESWIFDYCYINPARPIKLGRNVGVGGGSYLFTHGYWLSKLKGFPVSYGPITIDDDVWLPWGCFIMPGVNIGSGAVVGARSVVTKSLPAGVLAAGSPAKVLRDSAAVPVTLEEQKGILLEATEEFARTTGRSLAVTTVDDWLRLELDGQALAAIANQASPSAFPTAVGSELCVVHTDYRSTEGRHPRLYSLSSCQCCPYDSLGPLQRDWLRHLRLIGVRYYPIDEVVVEPQA
jgi:acetyltransferase-like isoleucine patch superfamily enzyme